MMFEVATSLVLTNNCVKVRMVTGDNPQTAKAKCFMDIQM
jgi:magnesium-transporting ATPase (P-type)